MNAGLGVFSLLVYFGIFIGVLWLSIALVIAQFRTAKATERSAELLARIARKLDPPAEKAVKGEVSPESVTFYDLKNTAEEREWRNGNISTKADLEQYRLKKS